MKIRISFAAMLFFSHLFYYSAFSQTGIITGIVTDSKSHEPLPGVNLVINEMQNVGTTSDIGGNFTIKVPVGSYSLRASMIGYKPVVKTDVIVRTENEVKISIQLSETVIDVNEIIITADYFDKSVIENDLSTIVLGSEEVRRAPGSSLDVQRILQGVAGVSFSTDRNNELIVRGGAPDETLVILDNMEIHSINHFPDEYNSGGAVNMINVALLQNIQFSTGGFISKYGDKISSVMNIDTREGSRTNSICANFNLTTAGIGTILEGRINNGRGSWLISARNSFLELISNAIGKSSVPQYYDLQFKLNYDISSKHSFSLSGIYGHDKISEDDEFDDTNYLLAGKIDSVDQSIEKIKQYQYAIGFSLRSIWNKNLYSALTIYGNNYHFDIKEIEHFSSLKYDSFGGLIESNLLQEKITYDDFHDNSEVALKEEFVWNINKLYELNFGISLKTIRYKQHLFFGSDSSRYDIAGNGWDTPDDIYVTDKSSSLQNNIEFFNNLKSYLFVNNKIKLFNDRLILNLGLRYDYFSFSKKGNISPRISASFSLIQGITNINVAYGHYYQTQSFPIYNDKYNSEINKHLKNTFAQHFVVGLDHILSDGLKLTLEGYYKNYSDIPISEEYVHYFDRTFRSERNLNVGKKYACGFDLLLQQKLVKDIYGVLAYSRMWSKFKDPRIGMAENYYPSEYEYPNVFTLVCGKRFDDLRSKLNKMPFFIKYPSYILPFSDDMEISLRWHYATGKCYTPKIFAITEQHYEGGMRWTKGNWISADEINSKRYPPYHRLDISFSSRFNFSNWSLTTFLSVENIYNRKNIARYRYKSNGTYEEVNQFSLLPVAGIEVQFQ